MENWNILAMATKYAYPMQNLLKTMSLCIGLAMTVERWVAVCKPLEVLVRCTQKVSIRMLKIIVICSVFFNSPKFFELEPGILSATGNLWYFFLYHVLMSLLFDYMVPFVVMALLNYQSILELRESQQRAESLTTSKIDYGKAIRMLWVVTLFFAACHVFGAALRIAESFVDQKNELFKLAAEVSQMCILFYSSALFFIYWYFSSFYQERLRLLFKQKPGNYFEEKWVNLFRRSGTTAANFYIELDENLVLQESSSTTSSRSSGFSSRYCSASSSVLPKKSSNMNPEKKKSTRPSGPPPPSPGPSSTSDRPTGPTPPSLRPTGPPPSSTGPLPPLARPTGPPPSPTGPPCPSTRPAEAPPSPTGPPSPSPSTRPTEAPPAPPTTAHYPSSVPPLAPLTSAPPQSTPAPLSMSAPPPPGPPPLALSQPPRMRDPLKDLKMKKNETPRARFSSPNLSTTKYDFRNELEARLKEKGIFCPNDVSEEKEEKEKEGSSEKEVVKDVSQKTSTVVVVPGTIPTAPPPPPPSDLQNIRRIPKRWSTPVPSSSSAVTKPPAPSANLMAELTAMIEKRALKELREEGQSPCSSSAVTDPAVTIKLPPVPPQSRKPKLKFSFPSSLNEEKIESSSSSGLTEQPSTSGTPAEAVTTTRVEEYTVVVEEETTRRIGTPSPHKVLFVKDCSGTSIGIDFVDSCG
ncbi:hypothetical protein L5515_019567 [Caenorhabditis briggsae]|uniref:G-protein coupled receptors family 1 profile domain-containing protein n=1 Tax=Caenorhabditis briggsae TaxID=6238 RepID=A0AAE9FEH4_CAEBR|nr:hypothetical protein L5515_019567 [Caenorhabditis briggsae]